MSRPKLTREALANAVENWISLPLDSQLKGILSCAEHYKWTSEDLFPELRHWLTSISTEDQKVLWGASLYGEQGDNAEGDGDKFMQIIEHVWLGKYN